jgi:hypothetical protein
VEDNREKFNEIARLLFNTPNGKYVLEALIEDYVYTNPVRSTIEETYHMLGKQDLVQALREIAESDENDNINVLGE